jgi:urease accessory protein
MTSNPAHAHTSSGWSASLELAFEHVAARTELARRVHVGPLRVQRPFHPEPSGACHVYLLHPPGGVVGGDRIDLSVQVRAGGAHALITTPAAQKLYRSLGACAEIGQWLCVDAGSTLEWLPQETIAFQGARARIATRVELQADARFLGWEITCLGRPASGEPFERGELLQRVELVRAGKPLWIERALYQGGDVALHAPWGLASWPVTATLLCVAAGASSESCLEAVRGALAPVGTSVGLGLASASAVGDVLVVRYLGPSSEQALRVLQRVWRVLRPLALGCEAVLPRVWAT